MGDVQTCGYEDVQVMWEMLQRNQNEVIHNNHKHNQLPFWRIFVWSSNHSEVHNHQITIGFHALQI
ncbi:hypothetical protein Lalb_Chr24g0392771 [Lupinus albus]|uniref:Uncharacterized protein n=1 Tax=Lupinus albus TaxID=3870 RepID=A0A6A4N1I9_LUPAL|nr:hypothetical protein Lalb_Chr24g0392771 [Lupinus albus]